MRPLRLHMRAFGPFAGDQELDFGELGGHGFFLIHGPTGAGKSTVLDAICFALYGKTSGGERDARDMRSDLAAPGTPTEVTLDFAVGDKRYRVTRRPAQYRPAKKGDGMVHDAPKAHLWDRTASATDDEGAPLAVKVGEVDGRIVEILGFHEIQFRQVVVLPQGQFQKLLRDRSSAREQILQKLFRTEQYREVQEALKQAAAVRERELGETLAHRKAVLDAAGVAGAAELIALAEALDDELAAATGRLEQAAAAEALAQAALTAGERAAEALDELEVARDEAAAIAGGVELAETRRAELAAARRAAAVKPQADLVAQRRADLEGAERRVTSATEASETAAAAHAAAAATLATVESRSEQRDALDAEVRRLEGSSSALESLATATTDLEAAQQALDEVAEAEAVARDRREAAGAAFDAARDDRDSVVAARDSLADLERLAKSAADLAAQRTHLDSGSAQLETLRKEHAEALRSEAEAAADLSAALGVLTATENEWIAGQAAGLAGRLVPGAPCPVCGSPDHPAPAAHEGAATTDEALAGARERVEARRDAERDAHDRVARTAGHVAAAEQAVAETRAALGDTATSPLADLDDAAAAAGERLAEATALVARLDECEAGLKAAAAERDDADEALAGAQEARGAATSARDGARVLVDERGSRVPDDQRDPEAVALLLAAAREQAARAHAELEAARRDERDLHTRSTAARSAHDAALSAVSTAGDQLAEAAARFDEALVAEGFADADACHAAARDAAAIAALDEAVAAHDAAAAASSDRVSRAQGAAEGLRRPDLEALRGGYESAHAETVGAHETVADLKVQAKAKRDALKTHDGLDTLAGEREAEYAVVGRLSKVANGDNAAGLSFQRFMLGAYLDDVLIVASRHLHRMTEGRYQLQRVREPGDRRSAAGLDLEVIDATTGRLRDVSTLSGGETFQASLALALALADVVQHYEGGIRLDTVFVDEGFGSLDPDNLAAAIDMLSGLREGDRLVGIISHVTELRDQIAARLEITPGPVGSSARFVVP